MTQKNDNVYYVLSPAARCLTLRAWTSIGGCGMPSYSGDPMARAKVYMKKKDLTTLGELAEVDPFVGRAFARFAADVLERRDLAIGPMTVEQLREVEEWGVKVDGPSNAAIAARRSNLAVPPTRGLLDDVPSATRALADTFLGWGWRGA